MRQHLLYSEYPIPPELAGSIQGIWRLHGECREAAPHVVLPDGCISLVLNFGAPLAPASASDAVVPAKRHGLLGEVRRPLRVLAHGEVDLMGVRLVPGSTLALSRVPLADLVDQVSGEAVLTNGLAALVRTLESAEASVRAHLLARGLKDLARRDDPSPSLLQMAVGRMMRQQGNLRVDSLAMSLGVSRRNLERLFAMQLGFSPKSLCDVLRFQAAVRLAQQRGAGSWADIACEAGYFDQSHLIRAFRRFAGAPPTGLEEAIPLDNGRG